MKWNDQCGARLQNFVENLTGPHSTGPGRARNGKETRVQSSRYLLGIHSAKPVLAENSGEIKEVRRWQDLPAVLRLRTSRLQSQLRVLEGIMRRVQCYGLGQRCLLARHRLHSGRRSRRSAPRRASVRSRRSSQITSGTEAAAKHPHAPPNPNLVLVQASAEVSPTHRITPVLRASRLIPRLMRRSKKINTCSAGTVVLHCIGGSGASACAILLLHRGTCLKADRF